MTRKQAEALIAEWGGLLCPEWDITIEDGPWPVEPAASHFAATETDGDYLRATLYLHEILTLEEGRARQTLAHELLHLTLHDLCEAANRPLAVLGIEAGAISRAHLDHHIERTVDRLATAFENVS